MVGLVVVARFLVGVLFDEFEVGSGLCQARSLEVRRWL